jgi:hypothetical protein
MVWGYRWRIHRWHRRGRRGSRFEAASERKEEVPTSVVPWVCSLCVSLPQSHISVIQPSLYQPPATASPIQNTSDLPFSPGRRVRSRTGLCSCDRVVTPLNSFISGESWSLHLLLAPIFFDYSSRTDQHYCCSRQPPHH